MKARLKALWMMRSPRERMIAASAAALLAALLLVWLVHSASRARSDLLATVTALRRDALRLDREAAEIERLRAAPIASASHTDVRKLLEADINANGLSGAVVRMDAAGPDEASVVLGALAFADWLTLLQRLQVQHVRLEKARIEALTATGMVSVTASFVRGSAP